MNGEAPRVICLGMITVDIVAGPVADFTAGGLTLIDAVEMHPGGCALNSAIDLAHLGVPAAIVGPLGDDDHAAFLRRHAQAAGIDVSGLTTRADIATSATVLLIRPGGQRDILQCAGSNKALRGADIDLAAFPSATHLQIGGYFTLDGFDGVEAAKLLQRARAAGLRTSADTAWDPHGRWLPTMQPALPHLDVFFTNEDEGRQLTGHTDPAKMAGLLHAEGPRVVVIKLGGEGCLVHTAEEVFRVPAFPIAVVDTTGAGDAFVAGFLAAQVWGGDLRRAARVGCAAGGRACEKLGATAGIRDRGGVLGLVDAP